MNIMGCLAGKVEGWWSGDEALWDVTLGCAGSIMVCLVDHGFFAIIMGCQGVGGGVKLWDIFPVLEERRLVVPLWGDSRALDHYGISL